MFLIFISVIVYKIVTSHAFKNTSVTSACFLAHSFSLPAGLAQAVHMWYIWGGGVPLAHVFIFHEKLSCQASFQARYPKVSKK